ncbi:TetR/AcrR family transcriptional regulator [Sphingomonas sp. XXL09]|uniref:TetR/AcrR family transcriptional regulator n=1 Tax=Sphingomonas sp. XXL09 TaxID=3457787 RepID=UPI00406BDB6F
MGDMPPPAEPTSAISKRRRAANKDARAAYANRRQEMVEAAIRVFNRMGYQAASISAVAAELGVDRATLYYYFSSKEQMFDEIVRSVLEANADLASRISAAPISPIRKLRELVTAMMNSYASNYPLLYIYIREDLSHVSTKRTAWSDEMRALNRRIETSIVNIVEQGVADGSLRRIGSPRTVAFSILGMLNWTHRWYRPDRGETADEIGKIIAEMAISGLESPYAS